MQVLSYANNDRKMIDRKIAIPVGDQLEPNPTGLSMPCDSQQFSQSLFLYLRSMLKSILCHLPTSFFCQSFFCQHFLDFCYGLTRIFGPENRPADGNPLKTRLTSPIAHSPSLMPPMAKAGKRISAATARNNSTPGKRSNCFVPEGNVGPTPM